MSWRLTKALLARVSKYGQVHFKRYSYSDEASRWLQEGWIFNATLL